MISSLNAPPARGTPSLRCNHRPCRNYTHTFFAAAKTWTPAEALDELPRLTQSDARQTVATELASQFHTNVSHAQRHFAEGLEAIAPLGLTPTAWLTLTHGREAAPRLEAARTMLRDSRAAYEDLAGYAIRKLDPSRSLRSAAAPDVLAAGRAPWLAEHFRREELHHAVTRTLGDLLLPQNADGRLTVDLDARNQRPGLFELRVPESLRLRLAPGSGFTTYAQWLGLHGLALHRAHAAPSLSIVERRLGDAAVLHGVRCFFESFLLDEGWHRRYLRLTARQAREAARAFAFHQLQQLRALAGLAEANAQALTRGQLDDDDGRSHLGDALAADFPRGVAAFEVSLHNEALLELDGFSLAHVLRAFAQERFNEDYWRNPSCGRWLLEIARAGQRDDAPAIAAALNDSLRVTAAASLRTAIMGA